ncbi:hypothetical protein COCNU_11G003430 [Cocos nucifera]|uniref:Uncharacterized protein n=1 Tax=Cocos nucifera TaxID=13894 RepID=A0A8K0N8L5_COCNU|nr:hypothetical protein COCNU_11G003430 [Cocos nucifera]
MWVPCGLDPPTPEESHETSIECLFCEMILSLAAPNISDLSLMEEMASGEETTRTMEDRTLLNEGAEIFETTSGGTPKGKESVIETGTSRTLFIENTVDLSFKIADFEVKVVILKKTKDQLSKAIREAFDRAKAAEKKFQDAKAKTKKLKAQVVKAKASKVEALLAVKTMEEKASRAVDDFQASEEFRKEKASFALDAYDEEKCIIHEEVASKYPGLDLSFLDEISGASASDVKDTS